jgi:hypothetical protein
MSLHFDFTEKFDRARREQFADALKDISDEIGFKVSSRGWCYIMEQKGFITKNQFSKVDNAINTCRKEGLLPVDFVAEEKSREFEGVEKPSDGTVNSTLAWMLRDVLEGAKYYTPDWWDGEKYYIQMVVEKIDLVQLFGPICREYHIPIANSKGWSSILQAYLKSVGRRKCEANAIVVKPTEARRLCRTEIESWLGVDAKDRFAKRREEVERRYQRVLDDAGLAAAITEYLDENNE